MSERPELSQKDLKKIIGEGISEHRDPLADNEAVSGSAENLSYTTDPDPLHQNPALAEAIQRAESSNSGDSRQDIIEREERERAERIAREDADKPKKTLLQEVYGVGSWEDIDKVTVKKT